jgi:hypothetical protein
MTHIRWTVEEREDLAGRTANIVRKQGVTMIKALRRAQEAALPKDRQRKIGALDRAMRSSVQKHLDGLKEQPLTQAKPPEIIKEILVLPLTLRDAPLEDLVNEIIRRTLFSTGFEQKLHNMVVAPIAHAIRQELPTLAKLVLTERKAAKAARPKDVVPRVLVIGLLPEQENEITKSFENAIRLDFYKDGRIDGLRALAGNVDRVILMQRFSSHSVQEVAKAVSGKRFMVCSGATSHLKAILEHLYLQEDLT